MAIPVAGASVPASQRPVRHGRSSPRRPARRLHLCPRRRCATVSCRGEGKCGYNVRADVGERKALRFFINGGAGFIGSHLAEKLLERGHRVHVLDDLSTGTAVRHGRAARDGGRYGMVPKLVSQALGEPPLTVFGDGRRLAASAACRTSSGRSSTSCGSASPRMGRSSTSARTWRSRSSASPSACVPALTRRSTFFPYNGAYSEGFEDTPRRYPDIAKIEAVAGWTPTRSLDGILEDAISFQQAEASAV